MGIVSVTGRLRTLAPESLRVDSDLELEIRCTDCSDLSPVFWAGTTSLPLGPL